MYAKHTQQMKEEVTEIAPFDPTKKRRQNILIVDPGDDYLVDKLAKKTENLPGETLCKGLNKGFGTLLAGLLVFFIEYVADATGQIFQAVFIGVAVFLLVSF
ncbi:Aluminum-activated malate transporter [Sesbania bispinosa]|nr:Aluminum-activated malate transporter [Sesbania bispinosa]